MRKIEIIFGILIIFLVLSCSEKQNKESTNKCILTGNLIGFEDNSWIYLSLDGKTTDSTQIIKNAYSFEYKINEPAKHYIFIKNTQNYATIWLEVGKINFTAEKGEFRNAKISGSKSQTESDILYASLRTYRKRRDSLTNIVRDSELNDSLIKSAREGLQEINSNHLKLESDFIKNYPNSYVSAQIVNFYSTTFGKARTKELFDKLSEDIKNSSYGKSIQHYLELNNDLKVGDKYVDFAMNNDKDELIKLSDFDGKLILLDFWSSWCGPCIDEYPALRTAYSKFKDDGLEIVSISQDQTKERWKKAISSNELNWINLWEEGGNKSDPHLIYGICGIPDNFLIDKNGIIVARNLRGEKLISVIEEELGK